MNNPAAIRATLLKNKELWNRSMSQTVWYKAYMTKDDEDYTEVFDKQGLSEIFTATKMKDGEEVSKVVGTKSDGTGELNTEEYDDAIRDLVNFLEYSGDPVKLERHAIGWWVMGFLVIFTIVVVLLKKEYCRDVH